MQIIKGINIDVILTDDDKDALSEAEEDLKKGKTKRLVEGIIGGYITKAVSLENLFYFHCRIS